MLSNLERQLSPAPSFGWRNETAKGNMPSAIFRFRPQRLWYRWIIPVVVITWLLTPSSPAQTIDLTGWNLRTEQSGAFRCTGNVWQQVELLTGSIFTWDGTYTATRTDSSTVQIKAEPDFGTTRAWTLRFDSANAGTYTLDYTILDDFTIHEEGRFYNSQTGLGYADWAQMSGQIQNGPEQVWTYLIGEPVPKIEAERNAGVWEFRIPVKTPGRTGIIEIEESPDLNSWSVSDSPIQVGTDRQRYYRLKASLTRRPVMKPAAPVRVGAVTVVAGTTAKVTGLVTVNSLEITTHAGNPTAIQITETPKPAATAQIRPLTGLIGIQGLEALAPAPIEVRVNVNVPKDHFAMGFLFDRNTGRFEGMPLKELAADHATVVSRHFCEFILLEIPNVELPSEVDSGFRPGTDDWEFTNYGSYAAPGGHCAGQALSAMYYYVNQRQDGHGPALYGMWDNPGNDWATPTVETDDQRGYALASVLQTAIDWEDFANDFWWYLSPGDLNTYRCFVFSMWITGEPQEIGIYRPGGGHALVAWKCAYNSIHVADPNYPGNDTRWINLNAVSNRFDPYQSGPTADELGFAYPTILYFGKTTMIDWRQVSNLWAQASAGTIGATNYPLAVVRIVNEDGSLAGSVTNSMAGGLTTIPITGAKFSVRGTGWNHAAAFNSDGTRCPVNNGYIQTEGETNRIGIELLKEKVVGTKTNDLWLGFQWFEIVRPRSISLLLSPLSVTLAAGESQIFTATVTGTANTTVAWRVQEGADGGTITSAGLYTAPNIAGTYHVIAASASHPAASATATITVQPPPLQTEKFSRIQIRVTKGVSSGVNCDGDEGFTIDSKSSVSGIPVLWSNNRFSIAGSAGYTNKLGGEELTMSISGTMNADGTISLSGTSRLTKYEFHSFWEAGNFTNITVTTASITLDRAPKVPPVEGDYRDQRDWLIGSADRSCLKSLSAAITATRYLDTGKSELLQSCAVTDVDWTSGFGAGVTALGIY